MLTNLNTDSGSEQQLTPKLLIMYIPTPTSSKALLPFISKQFTRWFPFYIDLHSKSMSTKGYICMTTISALHYFSSWQLLHDILTTREFWQSPTSSFLLDGDSLSRSEFSKMRFTLLRACTNSSSPLYVHFLLFRYEAKTPAARCHIRDRNFYSSVQLDCDWDWSTLRNRDRVTQTKT